MPQAIPDLGWLGAFGGRIEGKQPKGNHDGERQFENEVKGDSYET